MEIDVEIRELKTQDDFERVVEIQRDAWGWEEEELVPDHILQPISKNGGQILGAVDNAGRIVAFSIALLSRDPQTDKCYLFSHLVAVEPNVQSKSIGLKLKLAQREFALKAGITKLEWTFDPMQTKNATVNMKKINSRAYKFYRDYYGALKSTTHQGLPTDRLLVEWDLTEPPLREGGFEPSTVLVTGKDGLPYYHAELAKSDWNIATIEVPLNFPDIKRDNLELARTWQKIVTDLCMQILNGPSYIDGFLTDPDRGLGCYRVVRIK